MVCYILCKIRIEKEPKRRGNVHDSINDRMAIGCAVLALRGANQRLESALESKNGEHILKEMQYNRKVLNVWKETERRYKDGRKSRHVNSFVLQTHRDRGAEAVKESSKLLSGAESYLRSCLYIIWANTGEEVE